MTTHSDAAPTSLCRRAVVDARLFIPALTVWISMAACLNGDQNICAAIVLMSTCGCLAMFTWSRRSGWSPACNVVLACCIAGCCSGAISSVQLAAAADHPLRSGVSHASVIVRVTGDPRRGSAAAFGNTIKVAVAVEAVEIKQRWLSVGGDAELRASRNSWLRVIPGTKVLVRARVVPNADRPLQIAALVVDGEPHQIAAPPWYQRTATWVRMRLQQACEAALSGDARGLLPGLIVGDTTQLSPHVRDDFRTAGLAHLTAVSGANITILLGAVALLLRAATVGPRTSATVSLGVLAFFVVIARPSASVTRAAAMGSIAVLALMAGRRRQALPALAAAVLILIVWQPTFAVDVGFALSVLATSGLILLAPRWVSGLENLRVPRSLAEVLAVSAAALVVTAPITVAVSGSLSLVALLANIAASALVGPLTVLGAIGAVVSCISVAAASWLIGLLGPALSALVWIADTAAAVPGAQWQVPFGRASPWIVGAVSTALMVWSWMRVGQRLGVVARSSRG